MSTPRYGELLYQLVPAVYRNRDNGDLRRYFEGSGRLLDQIHATLLQRLADNFPDTPVDGAPCQDWLLPYFAELLDVRLVSPSAAGRRDEVANAVRWRQGKGTLRVVEEIAESIGRLEVVLHEGWRRVATTPRLGRPQLPASSFGYAREVAATPPSLATLHPDLPVLTVDFRRPSGALASAGSNPGSQRSRVDGDPRVWRQASVHGVPCHPDSYEDVSRRSVDFRRRRGQDWRVGHYHPRRLLLYTVPPTGFFPPGMPGVNWSATPSAAFLDLIEVSTAGKVTTYRNKTYGSDRFVPVRVRRVVELGQAGVTDDHRWHFQGLVLDNTLKLDAGRVEFEACALRRVVTLGIDREEPVIAARDCLIRSLQAARSLVRLEYCTVLGDVLAEVLEASDSIFLARIHKDHLTLLPPDRGCLRYSRVVVGQGQGGMEFTRVTAQRPVMWTTRFGGRGCGVLHPATAQAINRGAEDGAEMGAFHRQRLSLLAQAVIDKLVDYLPVGLDAIVIPDPRLVEMPD